MNPILLLPRRFVDERGWFMETYVAKRWRDAGVGDLFVQDNHSLSVAAGTIRGIHFQRPPHAQAKLVRCTRGSIRDYVVDLRSGSPTYGRHVMAELTCQSGHQLYVPVGFGHAFVTLEPNTEVEYKVSTPYAPHSDGGIRWDCPDIAIDWQLAGHEPFLSPKDTQLPVLAEFVSPFAYDGVPLSLATADVG